MTHLLYIAVRGQKEHGPIAACDRRLYVSESAAWAWVDSLIHPFRGGHVHEVDLDETVKMSREPEPTWQARYEHAERRATRWLGLMERLEPLVRRGEKPTGTWTLKAVDLERLVRVFSAWSECRTRYAINPATGRVDQQIESFTSQALYEALTAALAGVDRGDLERGT